MKALGPTPAWYQRTEAASGLRRMLVRLAVGLSLLGAASASAQDGAVESVTIGGTPSLLYLPVYIAIEEGYFAKRNVDVELVSLTNVAPALISGDVDFGMSGAEAAVLAAVQGRPTPAVAMLQQRNSLGLVVGEHFQDPSGLAYPENVKALQGKTVAINRRGAGAENFMNQVFEGADMTEGIDFDVILIAAPASIIAALKTEQVDAGVLWPPFTEQAVLEQAGYPLVREWMGEGPETRGMAAGASLLASPEMIANRTDTVRKVVEAVVEAQAFNRDFEENKERLIDIATKYTQLEDRAVLAEAISTQMSIAYAGLDCDAWQMAAEGMIKSGTITQAPACEDVAALDVGAREPLLPKSSH